MSLVSIVARVLRELGESLAGLDEETSERLIESIRSAPAIFVAGAGRSRLMLSGFAMRLMHFGFRSYVVGETVTPAVRAGDLVIAGSGSGETATVVAMARKARDIGACLAVITANPGSSLGRIADLVVRVGGASVQPGGSLFEQSMLVYLDSIVLRLAELCGIDTSELPRHANLE